MCDRCRLCKATGGHMSGRQANAIRCSSVGLILCNLRLLHGHET